ncbi:MAG: tetratricopeptide repeat protein [Planctomycetota bacterium]
MVAIAAGLAYWWFRDDPRTLLREARAIARVNPSKADDLLIRSIVAAGGNFPDASLERSIIFAGHHQMDEAIGCFSQITNPRRCDPAELLRLAKLAIAENSDYLADRALNAARQTGPDEAEILRMLISLNQRYDRQEAVLSESARLAELVPEDPAPWLVSARIHDANRNVPEALASFHKALERNISPAELNEVRNDLAELYLHEGNLSAAREQLEQLRKARDPTESDRLKWAYLLRHEGEFEAALNEIEKVLELNSNHVAALELQGTLQLDCNRPDEAVRQLERVIALQPFRVEAHSKLGQAYQRLNLPEKSALHFKRSRELIETRIKLMDTLERLREHPENESLRDQAIQLHLALGERNAAANLLSRLRKLPNSQK